MLRREHYRGAALAFSIALTHQPGRDWRCPVTSESSVKRILGSQRVNPLPALHIFAVKPRAAGFQCSRDNQGTVETETIAGLYIEASVAEVDACRNSK